MNRAPRLSAVGSIRVTDVGYASTVLIGDAVDFAPVSLALAVQREIPRYYGSEGRFEDYPLFVAPIPLPAAGQPVRMSVKQSRPEICVEGVRIDAVSSSSMVQVGSNRSVRAESRVKHIRQLLRARNDS
ncbi:spore germination protein GerPE [Paenibacillus caseinilyticus]|uniref:Spore germination protein n=1 Tax=Paenibacillus mucilaginosus K02 TaxID=997761 RepID=I0BPY7_9BACL|nr:spore germination protein GerPE [Paenibacillus mucilaginosus]AFH64434.2 spore germination protein [Paenibacillus mucilaginosus K02]